MSSFSYNDLDFSTLGVYLERGPRPFLPPMQRPSVDLGLGDGSTAGLSRMAEKIITLDISVIADNHADLIAAIDAAALGLNSREDKQLILDERDDRFWLARPVGGVDWDPALTKVGLVALEFVAGYPAAYAVTPGSGSGTGTGSSVGVDCVVGGNAISYPVITLSFTAANSAWAVGNELRDERLSWNAPGLALGSGDVVTIECDPRVIDGVGGQKITILRSGDASATVENAGIEGKFPALDPGLTNSITVWDFTGSIEIGWRDRFLT